jgi:ADP-ribose pyrophosphatase YjhB (NUDIX family)
MKPRKFCPFCGAANRPLEGTHHRSCAKCGEADYLNPAPAVGIAILDGDRILLSLRAREPKKGQWDLVGGFVDAGETVEQATRREVQEETGCRVVDLDLRLVAPGDYDGQPTLNFLHVARIQGEPKAADDSAELRWWPLKSMPPIAWGHESEFVRDVVQGASRLARP